MMRSLLIKRVIPLVSQFSKPWNKIDCRLCSSERNESGKKSGTFYVDSKLNNQNASQSSPHEEVSPEIQEIESQPLAISSKYTSFSEKDAPVILDVEEERIAAQQAQLPRDPLEDVFSQISMSRGTEGVFDIHELVEVLKLCRAQYVCVLALPAEARYADYMCIVTGKSSRHMLAVAEFVRRVYKQKKEPKEPVPKIEGKTCKDWMAIDLGNIVLHIFSESAREMYDLENLWAVGSAFDPNCQQKEDSIVSLLQRHSLVLENLNPAG